MTNQTQYAGARILEVMHEAERYNAAIFDLIKRASPAGPSKVLEFGAGDGAFIRRFANDGVCVDGVEKDKGLRDSLWKSHARPFREDIREVESESCDFIYTVNVLEHISDLNAELLELHRVLRRDGAIFVFVPAFEMLWTSLDNEVGHVRRFTRRTLGQALHRAGFTITRMEYFDCIGFPAALVVRVLESLGMFRYQSGTVSFYDRRIFPISRFLDRSLRHALGKNLVVIARRP
jgi:SAM-dependent methyltransferase